jgi:AMMECR1 domain-containing protein
MSFESEEDLQSQVRPGIDGLILTEGTRRGTFLPAVWEQLPDVRTFLAHLKLKAGLPADYWSPEVRVSRYTTESFC